MRSLREGTAGFTELKAFELDLSDFEALATQFVESNADGHEVTPWLMRSKRKTRRLRECLNVLDLNER
jgi:hypothetical protein